MPQRISSAFAARSRAGLVRLPSLPKGLLTLGAGVQAARTRRRLARTDQAVPAQAKQFRWLASRVAATDFGRGVGLEANLAYSDFQRRIPLHTYEALVPFVERMKNGEADVLWPGRCEHYAVSSGTTAGRTKYLPLTADMRTHFNRTGLDSLLYYCARVGHARVFRGRHLFLGGATSLTKIENATNFPAYAGDLSAFAALNMPRLIEDHLYEPGKQIARLSDWPEKIAAIAQRTASRDISLVAGIPSWLLILADAVRREALAGRGLKAAHLQEIWPHLECLIHGGVPLAPFHDDLRAVFGPTVNFHEVYPASEGFIAVQDAEPEAGLRLLADRGIFYEFLPMREFDGDQLAALGPRTVPLEQVKPGEDYALVLTTPAGLCRYVIGDIVQFTSTAPARLVYAGRTQLQLSAFGEHVIEKELTDSLVAVCASAGVRAANFHVAPLFPTNFTGAARGRHEWWIELRETPPNLDAARWAIDLDAALMARNEDYEAKRKGGGLEPPVVRFAAPQLFENWMKRHGKWGGQNKLPRCRSDRAIADELTEQLV